MLIILIRPILTYGYQGVLKRGVHPECHTVVYSSSKGPKLLEGEKGLLTKKPIKIDMKDPSEKLDPLSRLNYAKTYTVEHNVKVFFIGRVAENHEQEVVTCFNLANPPVQVPRSGGHHSGLLDNTLFEHAEGDETAYRDAVNIPTASPAWGNTGDTQTYGSPISTNMYSPPVSQPYGLSYSATPQMPPGAGQQNFPPQDYPPQDSYHQPTYDDGYDD
jgi:hypothetical protein